MLEARRLLSNFFVTNNGDNNGIDPAVDAGTGTLRQAIIDADANPGPDTISFALPVPTPSNTHVPGYDPGFQTWTIHVDGPLPAITDQVNIDGYTQRFLTQDFAANEDQSVGVTGLPSGGTFTLTYDGQTTAPIPYNASGAQLIAELEALPNIGPGNLSYLGTLPVGVFVTFQGHLGDTPIDPFTADGSQLIYPSGFSGGVAISTVAEGATGQITSDSNALPGGFDGKVRVILEGDVAGAQANFPGLDIQSDHNIIRGLSIDGFSAGIQVDGPNAIGNLIQGNYLGRYMLFPGPFVNLGTSNYGGIGNGVGVVIASPTNNTVGGVTPETHNGIAGNLQQGVHILPGAEGNLVEGNTIGVLEQDATFYYQIGNGAEGVLVESSSNGIGGAVSGSTNIISANESYGVHIVGPTSIDNRVESNYIGTDINGTFKFGQGFPGNGQDQVNSVGNLRDGVFIDDAPDNLIGIPGVTQVIAGNFGAGIRISGASATGNIIQGDLIGVDLSGGIVLPNSQEGVAIYSSDNTVGGTASGAGNTISSNRRGVLISGAAATGNVVAGNRIGTDSAGNFDLGNSLEGVRIENASGNTIGGQVSTALNLISGNNVGVAIVGATSTGNAVLGNQIGTDASGFLSLGNSVQGVLIQGAPGNTIGGGSTTVRNIISGNHWGVTITDPTATGNLVQGNFIGTAIDGLTPLGNEVDGVLVTNAAFGNLVGGSTANLGNTIAFNGRDGVRIDTNGGARNGILSNSIFSNGALGINLAVATDPANEVTPNTPGGPHPGPNDLQNYPVLTAVVHQGNRTNVQATLNSTPNTRFTIQFFSSDAEDPSGFGEGQTSIGTTIVTTDASGNASILLDLSVSVPTGQFVTATATSAGNDTSEFSAALPSTNVNGSFLVLNTNDSGAGSLRQAILNANAHPGLDTIAFDIAPGGLQTISVLTPLPAITDPVMIDGDTEAGSSPNPTTKTEIDIATIAVQIDGVNAGAGAIGLDIQAPNSTIDGLAITRFSGAAISISGAASQGNWLFGNFLGTLSNTIPDRTYPTGLGNGVGISISSSNNRVGGSNPSLRNVIADNTIGVAIWGAQGTGNLVENSFILDNVRQGVLVASSNNTIGEALVGGGDVISGNGAQGIEITGGPGVQGNLILGDEIGTDIGFGDGADARPRGVDARPNGDVGILIENSPKNTIGGLTAAARNVIAGNSSDGVLIDGTNAINNVLQGNYIGFNINNGLESRFIPNRDGVRITSAGNTIGGNTVAAQNTIANNHAHGIEIDGPTATGNVIEGDVIGLNPDGGTNFGNTLDGIHVDGASNNVIGGTTTGQRNTISGNNNGVVLLNPGATGNVIEGNFIGTATDGLTDLGNAVDGVLLSDAPRNTVGGTAPGAGNVISGNNNGVHLSGSGTMGALVQGNFIGTDLADAVPIGNSIDGVLVDQGASQNTIGGLASGAGNTIANNVGTGVAILSGNADPILSNSIFANTALGIDLGGDGVTPNHPGGSTAGPNNLENYPVLTAVIPAGSSTNVQGTFNGAPGQSFTLQFFSVAAQDPSGFGQGQTLLGATTVTTDAGGNATFNIGVPVVVPSGQFVTATATDAGNDTSEFSNALPSVPVQVQLAAATYSANEGDGAATITVTRTGGSGGQVVVTLATGGGTGVAGTDYTAVNTAVIFNPGETSKTVTIPILDAHKVATSATVGLALSNPSGGATLGTPAAATLNIDDAEPETVQFSVNTFNATESSGAVTVNVTRNSGNGTATVVYTTGGGTAVPGFDYNPVASTLTFTPGQTSRTFQVPILDNHRIEGATTIGLALVSPNGAALGDPSTATITIAAHQQTGTLGFSAPTYSANPATNTATVTVTRIGGSDGQVSVNFGTGGGNAQPGVDYTPVSGTLSFDFGEAVQSITIPITPNRAGGAVSFAVALSQPGGGASLGATAAAAVSIAGAGVGPAPVTPSGPGPLVQNLSLLDGAGGIVGIVVQFNEPMDPIRADNVANYGYFVISTGADGVLGTGDDFYVALASAAYDPSTDRAILTPAAPLPFNQVYRIVLNQNGSTLQGTGLADTAGNLLDGDANGVAGGAYVVRFGQGTSLRYTNPAGKPVSVHTKQGRYDLLLADNGAVLRLQLESAKAVLKVPARSIKHAVPAPKASKIHPTVKVKAKPTKVHHGAISAAAVDAVLGSGTLIARRRRP